MDSCSETVSDGMRWPSYHPCRKKPVVVRDGKHFCTVHDPERVSPAKKRQMAADIIDAERTQTAQALLSRLGISGAVYDLPAYWTGAGKPSKGLAVRIEFSELEKLLARLGR